MKNIIKKSVWSLLAAGLLSTGACTNLDENLYDSLNDTNVDLTNESDLALILGAAVAQYRYFIIGDWFPLGQLVEEVTDQYVVPARVAFGWGDAYINLHKHDWGTEVGQIQAPYERAYQGIAYANLVCDQLAEAQGAGLQNLAQARFFRGMFYYHLFDNYGNVPLQTTQDVEPGYLPQQVGVENLYNWLVDEFKFIKENIQEDMGNGWGNKAAAMMTLAKLYLNKNTYLGTSGNDGYQAALNELNEIIAMNKYSLATTYLEPFKVDISDCKEVIFYIPQDNTHAVHYGWNAFCFSEPMRAAWETSCAAYNASAAIPQFLDTYHPNDQRFTDTWLGGQLRTAVKNSDGSYTPNSGDYIYYGMHDWTGTGILTLSYNLHSVDRPGCFLQEGYRLNKYEMQCGNSFGAAATDQVVYRYADVLMMKAECLLRLGQDEQTAADLVTQVRRRSFPTNTAMATRTVADLKGGSCYVYGHDEYATDDDAAGYLDWSNHIRTSEGGSDIVLGGLLDDLGWEFCGEFHRKQDLRRFTMTDGRSVFTGKSWFCKDATTDSHYEVFNIPYTAMKANITLQQNPGY
ncbi:MAG: RagB/SusD family nutrient uptake outer membrane protein [Muribaculaceae bacterium]|nr:RagB/SusD family nutrient uptake outer membrane protein [Muribaculaceae bacterium]